MIAARDQQATVRCPSSADDHPVWVKVTSAAAAADDDDDDNGARRIEVSTRRRLILNADVEDRDGVYLCILTSRSSTSARLAANLTVVSPCKHPAIDLALSH